MTFLESVIIGIVEGLTEYLPVSSTGHIILAQRMLQIPESEASNAFAICIQAGAIIAVLGLYFQRVKSMVIGSLSAIGIGNDGIGNDSANQGFRLACNIIVAFLPAVVFGLLFDDIIEEHLYGLWPITTAWFVGGMAILVVARWRRKYDSTSSGITIEELGWKAALAIGLIQCLAMWPGTSRSLVTIVGGVLVGLSLAAAVEFSFLLGVLTLLAATVYKARDAGPIMIDTFGWTPMIWGSVAAWISAVVAVKWMVGYLKNNGMEIFGYYRVILAVVVVACLLTRVL